jgi:hypothetical protein
MKARQGGRQKTGDRENQTKKQKDKKANTVKVVRPSQTLFRAADAASRIKRRQAADAALKIEQEADSKGP